VACHNPPEKEKERLMTKLIGIIGGVSWESTVTYYQRINQAIREQLGGLNSARLVIYSLNYEPILAYERQGDWKDVADILAKAAHSLESAGCEFIMLACNTLHKVAYSIESAVQVPFLHIADAAVDALSRAGIKKVGLLGTQFTMEEGFYAQRLESKYDVEVLIPASADRQFLDNLVYKELCLGKLLKTSRTRLSKIMKSLASAGAEGILLGCTELGLLVKAEDSPVPLFDTTVLHANKAVALALL
jgi:aspartate racemase